MEFLEAAFLFIDAAAGCAQECINKLRFAFFSETLFAAVSQITQCSFQNICALSERRAKLSMSNAKCSQFSDGSPCLL